MKASPPTDFTINIGSSSFIVDGFIAAARSEAVRQLFLSDPFAPSISVTPLFDGDASPIISFLNGAYTECPDSSLLFVVNVATLLVMDSFVAAIADRVRSLLNSANILPLFFSAYSAGADCQLFVDHLADEGEFAVLRQLSDEQLDLVLSSPYFWRSPEEVTPELIARVDFANEKDHRLAKHLTVDRMIALGGNLNRLRYAMLRYAPLTEI
jgi:hypothetical protein